MTARIKITAPPHWRKFKDRSSARRCAEFVVRNRGVGAWRNYVEPKHKGRVARVVSYLVDGLLHATKGWRATHARFKSKRAAAGRA